MKTITKLTLMAALSIAVIIATVKALAQTAPTLSISSVGTNTYNIAVGNSVSSPLKKSGA